MARPGNSPAQQLTRGTWSLSFPAAQLVSCRHSWHTGVIILPSTGLLSCISFPFTLLFYRCSAMIPLTLSFLHHVPLFVDYFFHFSKLEWVTFSPPPHTHRHQFKNVSKQYWLSCDQIVPAKMPRCSWSRIFEKNIGFRIKRNITIGYFHMRS